MMTWIWLGLFAVFIIIEAATVQLVTVWFAIGSFCSFVSSFFTENIPVQIVLFIAVSAVALAVTRPIVKKITQHKKMPTNADMYIGKDGIVFEEINNLEAKGLVKIKGSYWSARSFDDSVVFKVNDTVVAERIEGVKLIVKPKAKEK